MEEQIQYRNLVSIIITVLHQTNWVINGLF